MTPEQREKIVHYLGEGAKLAEASSMVGASWKDFARDFGRGKSDAESGIESELSAWYQAAQAARSRVRAVRRREAAETAGSRTSSDLLAYVRELESEEEPEAFSTTGDVRQDSPLLALTDKIEDDATPPEERDRLRGVLQRGETALHDLFGAMLSAQAET